jgi:Xaa-Pro aminopeptidase
MIFGRHSVLKRGCSTWDQTLASEEEFHWRLDLVRRQMAAQDLPALVIYGDNYAFADLCYLTNYFPKVRGGIAVVPRAGAISLLLNIGSRDVPFAQTLTWVKDVRASNQLGADTAKLLRDKGLESARVGLVDSGRGLPLPHVEMMKAALPAMQWLPCDALIAPFREKKSPLELAAMRAAGRVLKQICEESSSVVTPGKKEYELIAAIDRLTRNKGAEDIRILAGRKRLNPPSLKLSANIGSHWAVYVAVQHERYWAEAGRTFILAEDGKAQAAYQKAQEIVAAMASQLKPGTPTTAIDATARQALGERYATTALYGFGNGIGLNQWEAPFLNENDAREIGAPSLGAATLDPGMTLALRSVFESDGKVIIYGDSYEVTADGANSLLGV